MRTTHLRRAAAVVAAAALLAACGDDTTATEAEDPTSTTTTEARTSIAPSTTPAAEGPAADADEVIIPVVVTGDRVEGGGRYPVALGSSVTLSVTSDADDEVHLHGYDLTADVVAGEPSVLTFDATIPGVFEAELHDAGLPLVELEVS